MVKLVESSQWEEDLYQIETADPVEGGPDGVSNKQAKQLGGRTRYLKAQVEQSQMGLAQHIAAADPHTQYATKTDLAAKLAALVGQSPQSLDTLKELADALGNDPNFATTIVNALAQKAAIDSPTFTGTPKGPTAPQFDNSTRLATTAFIQRQGLKASGFEVYTATATLPASVCGAVIYTGGASAFTLTLPPASAVPGGARIEVYSMAGAGVTFSAQGSDTIPATGSKTIVLNAGDTMALQSNGIDHWELVGGSVALLYASVMAGANWKTPPQFDSSGKLATTAFVQQSAGNFQTRKYINGSATLAASDTGSWVEAGGTGPSTITLPSPATSNLTYTVTNVTSNGTAVTISTPTASIYNQASASASFSLDVGATVELVSDASNWTVIAHYTRSPSAQTAPQYDNSTRLATTAFVKQSGESFSGIQGINATASLNGGHVGAFIWAYGTGITLTLPAVAGVPNGATITIATPVGITVKGSGTENINNQSGGLSNTFALNAGEQAQFVSNTGAWYLASYTTVLGMTSPQFDNSNKLATTAFLQRALGNFQTFSAYTTSQTLTASQSGSVINFWGGVASTITLPSAATMPLGGAFLFNNTSTGANVTIARAGSDTILAAGGNTSIILMPGDSLLITSAGGTQWVASGGSAQLPFSGTLQRALGNFSGFLLVTSAATLAAAAAGQLVELNGSASYTTTLPAGSSVPQSGKMAFVNHSGANQTIATQGGDSIWSYTGGLVSSVVLRPGDSLELVSRAGQWDICGGSALLQFSASFGSNLATNGYQKLPSGLIIQWMSVNVAGGATTTYNFPIAFPNNAYAVVGSRGAPGGNASFNFSPISRSQFNAQNYSSGAENASLIAIGS
ncbi:gp53-like domain-containing protein [Burkholderia vietnamiensis]|uniref:gp53-like domain-containing protein n=1 Tax=Burkholderia vietnamiensis TaxID=60552 RepID=UPI001CF48203|nr:hypothetical protein [Burkholderia vietnamiensis]MCA8194468.1 hypothetical protein [Burkholderia vietnamiensis]HDR8991507.1 hypothetical protein [Burkholderia vietnamiensis]HDV6364373.1 hypothetical protein [Burkholderia cepacia]